MQVRVRALVKAHPSLVQSGGLMRGAADPFVIALAQERGFAVVTAERSKPSKPRIPDVCALLKVPCMTLVEMFRQEKWAF